MGMMTGRPRSLEHWEEWRWTLNTAATQAPEVQAPNALPHSVTASSPGWLRYRLGRMPEHDRGHIQFRRATLARSFTSTLVYAAAVIAAPFSPLAALAMLIFVPAMFNIPM